MTFSSLSVSGGFCHPVLSAVGCLSYFFARRLSCFFSFNFVTKSDDYYEMVFSSGLSCSFSPPTPVLCSFQLVSILQDSQLVLSYFFFSWVKVLFFFFSNEVLSFSSENVFQSFSVFRHTPSEQKWIQKEFQIQRIICDDPCSQYLLLCLLI